MTIDLINRDWFNDYNVNYTYEVIQEPQDNDGLLVFGDNLKGLTYLIEDVGLKDSVDLIYIDPPYNTGRIFKVGGTLSTIEDSTIAYTDKFKFEEYLKFIYMRVKLLYELLSEQGSFYLHCDYKHCHYLKLICDQIFGREQFKSDITRIKCTTKNFRRKNYGNIKDCILFYTKTEDYIWNYPTIPFTDEEIQKLYTQIDSNGERYTTQSLDAPGEVINGDTGKEWRGILPPNGRHWCTNQSVLDEWDNQGLIKWSKNGYPRKIKYASESIRKGKVMQDIWEYKDPTKVEYPTTKNDEFIGKIVSASSNKGSIVLDCFAGSGTTLKQAQKQKRKYIGIDNSPVSINILKKDYYKDKMVRVK